MAVHRRRSHSRHVIRSWSSVWFTIAGRCCLPARLPRRDADHSRCDQDAGHRPYPDAELSAGGRQDDPVCDLLRFTDPARHRGSLLRANVALGRPRVQSPAAEAAGRVAGGDLGTRQQRERSERLAIASRGGLCLALHRDSQLEPGRLWLRTKQHRDHRADGWYVAHLRVCGPHL